jgi:hypothetical protein
MNKSSEGHAHARKVVHSLETPAANTILRGRRLYSMYERLDPVAVAAAIQRCAGRLDLYVLIRTKDSVAVIEELVAYYLAHGAKQVYILDNSVGDSITEVCYYYFIGFRRSELTGAPISVFVYTDQVSLSVRVLSYTGHITRS